MAEDENIEVWQSTVGGTVTVRVRDKIKGGWKTKRIGGKGKPGNKIRISTEEREFSQDMIPESNARLDPFMNGTLVCLEGRTAARSPYELTDKELIDILATKDDKKFEKTVSDIEIELPLRRLASVAEKHASLERYNFIRSVIDDRYRVGGTQKAIADEIAARNVPLLSG